MKTIIFFREGLSGHYLKSLINNNSDPMTFRVDPWHSGIYDDIKPKVEQVKCLHKHLVDWQNLSSTYDLILTIQVQKKIYHAIYNNFYKKYLIENPHLQQDFQEWPRNQLFWYDVTYYNIKEYHKLYQQDLIENTFENIVNFDNILEIDYIEHIIKKFYNRDLTNNMRRIVKEYAGLQLQYDLSADEIRMQDIIAAIPDKAFMESPWFASYCIFKYETNNQLDENQREWSIDSVTAPIDKKFLLEISARYRS
jgi:hypothetical protein